MLTTDELRLICYRLTSDLDYDEEQIWAYVQRVGGHLSLRQDCIDFWLAPEYRVFLLLQWPLLVRRPDLDYA